MACGYNQQLLTVNTITHWSISVSQQSPPLIARTSCQPAWTTCSLNTCWQNIFPNHQRSSYHCIMLSAQHVQPKGFHCGWSNGLELPFVLSLVIWFQLFTLPNHKNTVVAFPVSSIDSVTACILKHFWWTIKPKTCNSYVFWPYSLTLIISDISILASNVQTVYNKTYQQLVLFTPVNNCFLLIISR